MNIAIIGCGYIGREIAKELSKKHFVTTATNSKKIIEKLAKISQKSVLLKANDEVELFHILTNNDLIIVCIDPDNPEDYESNYTELAHSIKRMSLLIVRPKTLFFTSSTIVYGEQNGKWVDEKTALNPTTTEAKNLINVENIFLSMEDQKWKVVILRVGNIYGTGKELSTILKELHEHTLPGHGNNFTNMIHVKDVIGSIKHINQHNLNGIFNIVDDDHPSRKELYDTVCQKCNISSIQWNPSYKSYHQGNKRVSNHYLKSTGYQLVKPKRQIS